MTNEAKLAKIKEQRNEIIKALNDPNLMEGTASSYSRITGYYRCTQNWNVGKKSELSDRKLYNL